MLAAGSALVYDTLIVAEKFSLPGNSAGVCLNTKFIPILLATNAVFTQSAGKRNSAYVSAQSICMTYFTWSVRKVSDRIFLCEHLTDYNLARLHEPTLNLSAHA